MTGPDSLQQRARVLEATLRQRMAEDAAWFAARQAEIAEWRAEFAEYLRDQREDAAMVAEWEASQ